MNLREAIENARKALAEEANDFGDVGQALSDLCECAEVAERNRELLAAQFDACMAKSEADANALEDRAEAVEHSACPDPECHEDYHAMWREAIDARIKSAAAERERDELLTNYRVGVKSATTLRLELERERDEYKRMVEDGTGHIVGLDELIDELDITNAKLRAAVEAFLAWKDGTGGPNVTAWDRAVKLAREAVE